MRAWTVLMLSALIASATAADQRDAVVYVGTGIKTHVALDVPPAQVVGITVADQGILPAGAITIEAASPGSAQLVVDPAIGASVGETTVTVTTSTGSPYVVAIHAEPPPARAAGALARWETSSDPQREAIIDATGSYIGLRALAGSPIDVLRRFSR